MILKFTSSTLRRTIVAVFLFALIAVTVFAADPVPAFKPTDVIKTTPVTLPPYTSVTLPNGLKVYLLPQSKLPTIAFRLIIKAGAVNDPANQAGITDFAASLLRKGANFHGKDVSANAISSMIDSVGGYLGAGADYSFVYATSWGLSKHSDLLLDLLSSVVQNPTFPDQEIMRSKYIQLSQIMAKKDEPEEVAREVFRKELYGNHPLGLPAEGDSTSVTSFTRDMAVAQWKMLAIPNNADLAVVGDFNKDEMVKKVTAVFGSWTKGELPPTVENAKVSISGIQVILCNQEDAVQSNIRFGHAGVARNHPEYYAINVMESILMGGDFDSRLTKVIRTEKGLTYGIGGGFRMDKLAGPMSIGTSTKTESTGDVVKTSLDVLNEFRKNGPTDDELKQAKMYLTGSYPLNFETPDDIASEILDLDLFGLPANTIPEYRNSVAKVTSNEVLKVATNLVHPDNILIVVVGKNSETRKQIEALKIPNLTIKEVTY